MDKSIPASRVEARIRQIDDILGSVERLRVEREVLVSLLRDAVDTTEVQSAGGNGDSQSITGMVMDYVRCHPGTTVGEVVSALRSNVTSKSNNVAKLLYSTIENLRRAERLAKDSERRLRVPE